MTPSLARTRLLLLLLCLPLLANAQLFRSYLASYGRDTNPCTVDAPCRLLPAALAVTSNGGEIWILDSANFNQATVTIDRSVSIQALPGQLSSISAVGGGPAFNIPPASNIRVALRNLVIGNNANSPGNSGIVITNAQGYVPAMLSVEDCVIHDLPYVGINTNGPVLIQVESTTFRNMQDAIHGENGTVINVANSHLLNTFGITLFGSAASTSTRLNLVDSDIAGSVNDGGTSNYGVLVDSSAATATVSAFVTRSAVRNVGYGLIAQAAPSAVASISVSDSVLTGNRFGVLVEAGGSISSLGNNHIDGNDTDVQGSLIISSPR